MHFYKTYDITEEFGGVQQFIYTLVEEGQSYDINAEVLALTSGLSGTTLLSRHLVHRVKRLFKFASTDFSFKVLSKFKSLASKADIIHYHFPYPLADVAHFFSKITKPCLISYHSDVVAQKKLLFFYQPLMLKFLSSVDAIVAGSPNYIESSKILNKFASKTISIPYGIDPEVRIQDDKLEFWRKKLPKKFFLFIGVFRYYKGLDFLLTAAKNLPCQFVLIGSGGLEKNLRRRAEIESINNVNFVGSLSNDDKLAILSLAYALVFPSHLRSEAFGITLLEGARQSLPLISCEIGTGTSFINIDGETGLVIPPANPIALRTAIMTLWEDEALAAKLGIGARDRFEAVFTSKKMTQNFVSLYNNILDGSFGC